MLDLRAFHRRPWNVGPDREHRARQIAEEFFGDRPHKKVLQSSAAVGAYYGEVDVLFAHQPVQFLRRIS